MMRLLRRVLWDVVEALDELGEVASVIADTAARCATEVERVAKRIGHDTEDRPRQAADDSN